MIYSLSTCNHDIWYISSIWIHGNIHEILRSSAPQAGKSPDGPWSSQLHRQPTGKLKVPFGPMMVYSKMMFFWTMTVFRSEALAKVTCFRVNSSSLSTPTLVTSCWEQTLFAGHPRVKYQWIDLKGKTCFFFHQILGFPVIVPSSQVWTNT